MTQRRIKSHHIILVGVGVAYLAMACVYTVVAYCRGSAIQCQNGIGHLTNVLLFFTLVAAVAAAWISMRAVEIERLEQRAWVDLELNSNGNFKIDGIRTTIPLSLRNLGSSPAQRIGLSFGFVDRPVRGTENVYDLLVRISRTQQHLDQVFKEFTLREFNAILPRNVNIHNLNVDVSLLVKLSDEERILSFIKVEYLALGSLQSGTTTIGVMLSRKEVSRVKEFAIYT